MSAAWIDASRPPRIPGTNCHAVGLTPMMFLILHISWFTLGLVVISAISVLYLSFKKLNISWLTRYFQGLMRARRISSRPLMYRRRRQLVYSYSECTMQQLRERN